MINNFWSGRQNKAPGAHPTLVGVGAEHLSDLTEIKRFSRAFVTATHSARRA